MTSWKYEVNSDAEEGFHLKIEEDGRESDTFPSVTGLSDGGFVVTWEVGNTDGRNDRNYGYSHNGEVYGQRYDAEGLPKATNSRLTHICRATRCAPR